MSLLKVNEIQIFNGTTVTITATTTETSADLNVGADLDVTGALTLGTALAIAEGGTGATDAATARTNLDVDQAGTDNSTDVSLVTTSHDYLSITGQSITLGAIDLAADVTGTLAASNGGTGVTALSSLDAADLGSGAATDGYVLTADGAGGAAWEAKAPIDLLSSGASIRKSDGTTAVLSESGGTVALENTSLGDTVLMPDNSNNVSTAPGIRFEADTDTGIGLASAGNLAVVTGGTERMRIDSSGNVGIGTTTSLTNKLTINSSAFGQVVDLQKSGFTYGSLIIANGYPGISVGTTAGIAVNPNSVALVPSTSSGESDNTHDLGRSGARWDDVYATNGTIQTSDVNEKQDIEELSEAEQRIAMAAKGLLRKYRWKSVVAEKGDDARIHFGIIAQDLKAAFEAEGLDAGRYGMFIHSEWWEAEEIYTDDNGVEKTRINTFDTEEEAPEGAVKRDRMGIRYSELLAFIIAAI